MSATRILISATLLCIAMSALSAQPMWPVGNARVAGSAVDSATGQLIRRTSACYDFALVGQSRGRGMRCARSDSTGRFLLDSLPAGRQEITVTCSTEKSLIWQPLRRFTIDASAGETRHLDVSVTATGCDVRPLIARRELFRGHYRAGFEESSFRGCDNTVGAWVNIASGVREAGPKWPPSNDKYYPSYYVEWEGTIRGPWQYGHMGVSEYELAVDRILVVRTPGPSDCK